MADASSDRRRCVSLVALGCRVSRAERDALAASLGPGFAVVGDGEPADFVVVNTCAVTGDADSASRQAIRRAAREHPGARIVATGCYAEVAPRSLAALPGVVTVVGARSQTAIPDLLRRLDGGEEPASALERALEGAPAWGPAPPKLAPQGARGNEGGLAASIGFTPAGAPGGGFAASIGLVERTRAFLKIQDGCDARCSYCIVPVARGPSRSLPLEEALSRIEVLGERHAEVVLSGVHLGAYGRDLTPRRGLADVVRAAAAAGLVRRLRLSSVEPLEFPFELLLDPASAGLVCEHFHVPLQSASPRVLATMRRPYRAAEYAAVVERLASLAPGACIGTDVMVGFPGETEEDHRDTVRLVQSLPLSYLHVFTWSSRPGTDAAVLPDPVPGAVARERARELMTLSEQRWRAHLGAQAGRDLEVVVERVGGGLARGTARQYVTVRWPAGDERRGRLATVRVEANDGAECIGARS